MSVGKKVVDSGGLFDGVFFKKLISFPHDLSLRGGFSHGGDLLLRD